MAWYLEEGPVSDVVISTRVRLARNLAHTPFPWRLKPEELDYVREKVTAAFRSLCEQEAGKALVVELESLDTIEALALAERRIISRSMLGDPRGKALLLFADEASGVLVNEEDHLRLYAVSAGLRLDETAEAVEDCAGRMESVLPFAKSDSLGYLTACPTNTGTGMRASVMMHVPGLVHSGVIRALAEKLSKAGFVLRGAEGEGTDAKADMIQLSNQVTLGVSAGQIVADLSRLVLDLAQEERKARRALQARDPLAHEDEIRRALGLLIHARLMTGREAMALLSKVRLGRELGLEGMPDYGTIQGLLTEIGEGAIQQHAGRSLDARDRDEARAALIRRTLVRAQTD